MNLIALKAGAGTLFNAGKLYLKDHAPQILMGVAIGSEVGAIVSSCYAMTKMDEVTEIHKEKMDDLRDMYEMKVMSEKEFQEETTRTYVNTGLRAAKYWALPVALTGLSITSGLAAYGIINKKYVGAMSSLALITEKFDIYRDNVIEDVGEERDKIYANNGIIRAKLERLKAGNLKNGTEEQYTDKEINKALHLDDPEKCFKEKSENLYCSITANPYEFEWSRDTVEPMYFNEHHHMYNVQFIHNYLTQYWNNTLITEGVVTLNRVLKSMGLSMYMSAEFDDIGWCLKEYDSKCDGFIDFGFDKTSSLTPERQMWLDPTPELEHQFKVAPDSDRITLVMNCCDIREAKKNLYGRYFGRDGKLNLLGAYNR